MLSSEIRSFSAEILPRITEVHVEQHRRADGVRSAETCDVRTSGGIAELAAGEGVAAGVAESGRVEDERR